ncbi:NUDIX hydrolase [Streptodolium elevatio]|uniref:NUDIX hydrolase n=1 Tax=Streptodolium elevatio TaxID=3157996 RepID=A0ABV3DFR0_9ACTN
MTQTSVDARPGISAAIIVKDDHVLLIRRKVKEGTLSWQFPAGQVEPGETPEETAVRETHEEVGLTVTAAKLLGERVHPATGRTMYYVACDYGSGDAYVADDDEIAEVAWVSNAGVKQYIPLGVFEPVQTYLDSVL